MVQLTLEAAAERLGVSKTISAKALNKRWRQIARENHPDLYPEKEEAFRRLTEAYETMCSCHEMTRASKEIDEDVLDDDLRFILKNVSPDERQQILDDLRKLEEENY